MTIKVGIVGTGFIGQNALRLIEKIPNMTVTKVLSRRLPAEVNNIPDDYVTNSVQELLDLSNIILEASGDAVYATDVLLEIVKAKKPIVTMDSELHVTTGSYFVDKLYLTESEGDQPGCLAKLKEEAEMMGFEPLAYVNIKGFMNLNPTPKEMLYWSKKQKLRLEQVVSFTDGTKLQIEQALVANGLGASIIKDGLMGGTVEDIKQTEYLGNRSKSLGGPISDYVVSSKLPPGVFIIADNEMAASLGDYGPVAKLRTENLKYFFLLRPYHLCHLEIAKSIIKVAEGKAPLLNNSPLPRIGVAAVTKKPLPKDYLIQRGVGSFDVRGKAVKIGGSPDHVPICLLDNARIKRSVPKEHQLSFDDVELPDTQAKIIYKEILDKVNKSSAVAA